MRITRQQRRRRLIGLTSLIDVIFLLLLFFMLSTTFTRFASLDLSAATQGVDAPPHGKVLLIWLMADGSLALNGERIDTAELERAVNSFVARGAEQAILQPRGDVRVEALVGTLERLRATDLRSVSLAE